MIAVVSQAWTSDAGPAAEAYLAGIEEFGEFHRAQPGFRGRILLRSRADDTHFTNIRFFDSVTDYEAMIHRPGYAERIEALAAHLRPHEGAPGKDHADVVVHDWPAGAGGGAPDATPGGAPDATPGGAPGATPGGAPGTTPGGAPGTVGR